MTDFLLFLVPTVGFLYGLYYLVLDNSSTRWVQQLIDFKFKWDLSDKHWLWNLLSHDATKSHLSSVVRHSPISLYFLVWQELAALAALLCFIALAILIPTLILLTKDSLAMALVVGVSGILLAGFVWQWLRRLD